MIRKMVPPTIIVMVDFNAKLGTDLENAGGAIERFSIGDINEARVSSGCLYILAGAPRFF